MVPASRTPPNQGGMPSGSIGRLSNQSRRAWWGCLHEITTRRTTHVAKVMVVDDAAFMRLRACKVLQDNGHEVVQAENGADAVRQYTQHRPDAVLMDITMPEM